MIKKLAVICVVAAIAPVFSRNYREGFKDGWNKSYDANIAAGVEIPSFIRKFKNV